VEDADVLSAPWEKPMRRIFELVTLAFICVAILYFTLLNLEHPAQFTYWRGHDTPVLPIIVFVGLAFAAGVLVTILTVGIEWLRKNVQIRQLRRSIKRLEGELDDVRNQPLREELRAAAQEAGTAPPDSGGPVT
jgi:uncharacterized membrane protein YciS (DUF1049 family)